MWFLIQEPTWENWVNINHSRRLIPSTSYQLIRHCVLCPRNMLNSKGMKISLHRRNFSMCVVNAGHYVGVDTIFTSWEQLVANTTSEICRVFMHFIAYIKASHSARKGDRLLRIAIAPIIVSVDPPFL